MFTLRIPDHHPFHGNATPTAHQLDGDHHPNRERSQQVPFPLQPAVPGPRSAARRGAAALALATALSIGAGMMTTAQAFTPEQLASAPAGATKPGTSGRGLIPSTPGESIVTRETRTPIAPGLNLTRFDRFEAGGWVRGQVLVADLAEDRLSVDHISSGTVTGKSRVTEQAEHTGAVAAVNGDYFDMNDTEAPIGAAVSRADGLVNSPTEGRNQTVAIGADGLGRLAQVFLEGDVTVGGTQHLKLTGVNSPSWRPAGSGSSPTSGASPRGRSRSAARTG